MRNSLKLIMMGMCGIVATMLLTTLSPWFATFMLPLLTLLLLAGIVGFIILMVLEKLNENN